MLDDVLSVRRSATRDEEAMPRVRTCGRQTGLVLAESADYCGGGRRRRLRCWACAKGQLLEIAGTRLTNISSGRGPVDSRGRAAFIIDAISLVIQKEASPLSIEPALMAVLRLF